MFNRNEGECNPDYTMRLYLVYHLAALVNLPLPETKFQGH